MSELAQRIEQLKALDRQQDFPALAAALKQLPQPQDLPEPHQAIVAYWHGKLALLEEDSAAAIAPLAQAVTLAPQSAASHYLLGSALVRQEQWLDARQALTQALQLQPTLAAARLELAAVLLALGEPAAALQLMEPLDDSSEGTLRGLRARAAVRSTADQMAAAALAADALALDSRLPESLLIEWLQIAGGLLLAGRWAEARAWLMALSGITPAVAATANPVPRRVALIVLLTLELLEPSRDRLEPWIQELRNLRWLPASTTEHQLWDAWLESWLMLVAGRLEDQPERDQSRCRVVLKALITALTTNRPSAITSLWLYGWISCGRACRRIRSRVIRI